MHLDILLLIYKSNIPIYMISTFALIMSYLIYENQGHTPFELLALLLLTLPLLFTFQKLVVLPILGERNPTSEQKQEGAHPNRVLEYHRYKCRHCKLAKRRLSDFCKPTNNVISFVSIVDHSSITRSLYFIKLKYANILRFICFKQEIAFEIYLLRIIYSSFVFGIL